MMHVGVDTPDFSVARVGARVEEGGHVVPEDKIRARYARGAPFIRAAVLKADRGMVFDNSSPQPAAEPLPDFRDRAIGLRGPPPA